MACWMPRSAAESTLTGAAEALGFVQEHCGDGALGSGRVRGVHQLCWGHHLGEAVGHTFAEGSPSALLLAGLDVGRLGSRERVGVKSLAAAHPIFAERL